MREDTGSDVASGVLNRNRNKAIESIARYHPSHSTIGGYHVIDKPVGAAVALDLSDRRFAYGANLKLLAKSPRKSIGPKAAYPVGTLSSKPHSPITPIIMRPDVTRDGTLNGV